MTHSLPHTVAAEVRAEVARQGKPQRHLAELLKLSENAISERMRGRIEFKISELAVIAEWLGVPVEQFLRAPERAA